MLHAALGNDLIDVFAGGHLDQNALAYFDNQSNHLQQSVTGHAATFFEQSRNLYQMISTTDAMQVLRNLQVKTDDIWNQNAIQSLTTLAQLQTAGPIMQRWVMANPMVREKYLNNEVQGYGHTYVNLHDEQIGVSHFDYRQVTDGMVQETEEGYQYTHYHEATDAEHRDLTLHEKADILRTWKMVESFLDIADEDPTSPVGNKL